MLSTAWERPIRLTRHPFKGLTVLRPGQRPPLHTQTCSGSQIHIQTHRHSEVLWHLASSFCVLVDIKSSGTSKFVLTNQSSFRPSYNWFVFIIHLLCWGLPAISQNDTGLGAKSFIAMSWYVSIFWLKWSCVLSALPFTAQQIHFEGDGILFSSAVTQDGTTEHADSKKTWGSAPHPLPQWGGSGFNSEILPAASISRKRNQLIIQENTKF